MKFLVDENVSLAAINRLKTMGHEVKSVAQSDLAGTNDQKIFQVGIDKKRILITRDHHFTNSLLFPPAKTVGIIYIRKGNLRSDEEADLIEQLIQKYPADAFKGKLLTLYKNLVTLRS